MKTDSCGDTKPQHKSVFDACEHPFCDKRPGRGAFGWFCWRNLLFSDAYLVDGLSTHDAGLNLAESIAEALGFNVTGIRDVS